MNIDIKIGNCVRKPEMVSEKMAKIVLAVNDDYVKKDGTRGVNYFNIIVWNGLAESCVKYLDKGSKIAVVGRTQNRSYEAKDGTTKFVSEIIAEHIEFLSRKQENKDEVVLEPVDDGDMPF